MKTSRIQIPGVLIAFLGAWMLAGCGGGSSSEAPPEPAQATLVVWGKGSTEVGLPMTVFVNGQQVGQLTALAPANVTDPPATGGARLEITRPAGSVSIRAQNTLGQVWLLPDATLATGQTTTQLVDVSNTTALTFAGTGNPPGQYPITVVLDGSDTLGLILQPSTSTCNAAGSLTRLRPAGTYRYSAISANRTCIWTGTIVASAGSCQPVALPACN